MLVVQVMLPQLHCILSESGVLIRTVHRYTTHHFALVSIYYKIKYCQCDFKSNTFMQ